LAHGRQNGRVASSATHGSGQKKLIFLLFELTILNAYIVLSSCYDQKIHRIFYLCLVRNVLAHAGKQPCPQRLLGRPAYFSTRIGRLDTNSSKHEPVPLK
jgi:hypothetical protein